MDDRFFEAWITKPWRVCGRKLEPLCLGHALNLAAIASPFAPYHASDAEIEDRITPGQLLAAVRVCAERWPHPGNLRPTLRDVLWRFAMERHRPLFLYQVRKFLAYRADHTSHPEFWENETDGGRPLTAPVCLTKAVALMMDAHLSEARAWSLPLGKVDYYIGALEERIGGQIRFLYDSDLEAPEPLEEVLSEELIIAKAREDLPPRLFEQWLAARRRKRKEAP